MNSKKTPKLLSWVILIAFLSVITVGRLNGESIAKSKQVQIHNGQPACIIGAIKTKSSVTAQDLSNGIVSLSAGDFVSIWNSIPKFLLTSLSERNSFYVRVTTNAP